jgi:hypothetical protein
MRHPSLLEMDAQDELVAPKDGDGRSNWRKLADTVASTTDGGKFIGSSFQDVVKHASIARVAEILSIPAFKRRAEDIKYVLTASLSGACVWVFDSSPCVGWQTVEGLFCAPCGYLAGFPNKIPRLFRFPVSARGREESVRWWHHFQRTGVTSARSTGRFCPFVCLD